MSQFSTSVVVLTLNAKRQIWDLLECLLAQTVAPDEILVIDSSSDDGTPEEVRRFSSCDGGEVIRLVEISRAEFDHGGTRRRAVEETTGDLVLFLTQDAMPADSHYIERLICPFNDEHVAISSGRQIARADAVKFERLVREFNYPDGSFVRTKNDLSKHGIKTFFTSDVCSAYRRTAYFSIGGFPLHCNTSEDMYLAIRAIEQNWSIAYVSDARVVHSHNLKPWEQFKRNWEVGYFLQTQDDHLRQVSEIGEGARLFKCVTSRLIYDGDVPQLFAFCFDCAARFLGNRFGRNAARKDERMRCS